MFNLIKKSFIAEFELLEYDSLENTMDIVKNYKFNTVVMTRDQKNARGKDERKWNTYAGNLFFSLILNANKKTKDYSQLSFLSAVAMKDTLSFLIKDNKTTIQCKWPNDILLNQKKICGILLKFEPQKNQLIIGIGVNIKHFPKDVIYSATSIYHEGFTDINVQEFLERFLLNFSNLYKIWNDEGFAKIRNKWLKNAYKIKQEITVKSDNIDFIGNFEDLNKDGTLILKLLNEKNKEIKSGDIF